jgi:hypothetical protein
MIIENLPKTQWTSVVLNLTDTPAGIIALLAVVFVQQSWVKHRPLEAAHERASMSVLRQASLSGVFAW